MIAVSRVFKVTLRLSPKRCPSKIVVSPLFNYVQNESDIVAVARSDGIAVGFGFQGAKYFLDHFVEKGLGGDCRLPLGVITDKTKKWVEESMKDDWAFEQSL